MNDEREARRAARRAEREERRAARARRAQQPAKPSPAAAARKTQARAPEPQAPPAEPRAPAPLPPPLLAARVTGRDDIHWFDVSGMRTLADIRDALGVTGRTITDFPRILDFGCGSGRVLRHLRGAVRPEQEVIGVDVDAEAVAWAAANLPGVAVHRVPPLPPSPIADKAIDLVVAIDVFSRVPEEVALAWLADLHRVVRPGGIALVSVSGRDAWRGFRETWRASGADEARLQAADAAYHRNGFFHLPARNPYERPLPDYYGTAIHTIDYLDRMWQQHFAIAGWLPRASLDYQDMIVLRKS